VKLGFALLCLAVFTLCTRGARAESILIAWVQPDYEVGDRWELAPIWAQLVPIWGSGGVHSAFVEVSLPATLQVRTWRGLNVSDTSEPVVYVPELSLLTGLVVGCVVIACSASRASRPQASQKWRSFQSWRFTASSASAQRSAIRL